MANVTSGQRRKSVLWIDDTPQNNIDAVRLLRAQGVEVIQCLTLAKAMEILSGRGAEIDAIVTDMYRNEEGKDLPEAGLELIRAVRAAGFQIPILVSTPRSVAVEKLGQIIQEGGAGAVSSGGETLEFLRTIGIP